MTEITSDLRHGARPVSVERRLWLWWVLAGVVGWGVGGALGVALGTPGYIIENGYMSISLGCVLTSVLQWMTLRGRLTSTGWWVPASVIAAVASGVVIFSGLVNDPGGTWITDVCWIIGASLMTPVAALMQWRLVLRRHIVRGAAWWVPAQLVGFLAGGIVGGVVTAALGLNDKGGGLDAVVVWTILGAGYGAVTGAVLLKLLQRPRKGSTT